MTSPAPDYGQGDDGSTLGFEEATALRLLRQLAERWPASLTLAGIDGYLTVVRTGDPRYQAVARVQGIVVQGWPQQRFTATAVPPSRLAIKPVSLASMCCENEGFLRRGWHERLPRQCMTGPPRRPGPAWGRRPMSYYEGLVGDILGRGIRVPWHPAACQAMMPDGLVCGHALVWHQHRTRLHPCRTQGCECLDFVRMWPYPATDPGGPVTDPSHRARVIVIGEMRPLHRAQWLVELPPGKYVRVDFFGAEGDLAGTEGMGPEGGTLLVPAGSAWWRTVEEVTR